MSKIQLPSQDQRVMDNIFNIMMDNYQYQVMKPFTLWTSKDEKEKFLKEHPHIKD